MKRPAELHVRFAVFVAALAAIVYGFRQLVFNHAPMTFNDHLEDMSYGWYVPLFSLYVLWRERRELAVFKRRGALDDACRLDARGLNIPAIDLHPKGESAVRRREISNLNLAVVCYETVGCKLERSLDIVTLRQRGVKICRGSVAALNLQNPIGDNLFWALTINNSIHKIIDLTFRAFRDLFGNFRRSVDLVLDLFNWPACRLRIDLLAVLVVELDSLKRNRDRVIRERNTVSVTLCRIAPDKRTGVHRVCQRSLLFGYRRFYNIWCKRNFPRRCGKVGEVF